AARTGRKPHGLPPCGRFAAARCQRLRAQHLQDRSCASRHRAHFGTGRGSHAAISVQQEDPVSVMQTYIGTPTSRVDGRAKVTGEAKYAGEFNVPNLAYGYAVESIIPKGRIARIDTSAALRVEGVLAVLTHE